MKQILSLEHWTVEYGISQEKFSPSFSLTLNLLNIEIQQLGNIVSEVTPVGLKQEEIMFSETIDI